MPFQAHAGESGRLSCYQDILGALVSLHSHLILQPPLGVKTAGFTKLVLPTGCTPFIT